MSKIIKVDNKVIVLFEDGSYLEANNVDSVLYKKIIDAKTEEEVFMLMRPSYKEEIDTYNNITALFNEADSSNILSVKGECVYWEEVSKLSLPFELVKAILQAEKDKNEELITTYKNFWTLMSLNPDEECRKNLYWFLNKWGLKLAKCGFFIAYRNVVPYKTEEDGTEIFTDAYSHTTRIKIGEVVTLPREKCDCDSDISCSRGLHAAAAGWLEKNYYGSQGMVVLINPCDVVAVPHIDNYGKLRCCAYLPIEKVEFDDEGHVIPFKVKDGFDCSYVTKVIYEGLMGTEEDTTYKIVIPDIPSLNKESVSDTLLEIAKKCITEKQL